MEYVIVSGGMVNHFILSNYISQNKNIKVIGVDKGIEVLDCLDIIPDYILGDFDSVDEDILSKIIKLSPDINIIEYNPEKDFTDTEFQSFSKYTALFIDSTTIPSSFGVANSILLINALSFSIVYIFYTKVKNI